MNNKPAHSHSHFGDIAKQTTSRLALSLVLTLAFVFIEAMAGILSNSLALLTDAAHNFTDVIALGLSWYAIRLTAQPASGQKTYGYHRAGILVALINSTTLVLISLGIFYEAYRRFMNPPEVESGILVVVGLIAVIVNLVTALLVKKGSEHDLNIAFRVCTFDGRCDIYGGRGHRGCHHLFHKCQLAGSVRECADRFPDPLQCLGNLRDALDILLEATPRDVDIKTMVKDIIQIEGVLGVHDLHVWSLTQNLRTMSAHILTDDLPISAGVNIQRQINEIVFHRYNIVHATLQLECIDCLPNSLYCDLNGHYHSDVIPVSPFKPFVDSIK